jgi:hypothetical protein
VKAVPAQGNSAFSFALVGDLPYGDAEVAKFDNVIAEINQDRSVRFVMHTGDIKGGSERCDDERILARYNQYQQFATAFILTPGDNDWTDCHRVNNGSYNPLERLDFLRKVFYPTPNRSLGQRPIPVFSQSETPGFAKYVENVLFMRNRIVFSTIHVIGSNNNLAPWSGIDPADAFGNPRADRIAEFNERQSANLNWLDRTFDLAEAYNAPGVFIMIQANPRFDLPATDQGRAGFNTFLDKLRQRSLAFGKPVVLAQGDFHEFMIDKPFDTDNNPGLPKFTRIQAFGSPRVHWVKVKVNPQASPVFSFEEKIVEKNIQ